MIQLYYGTGSRELQLIEPALPEDKWARLRSSACKLLRARNDTVAAELLESFPFELWNGTNGFGDEFSALYWRAPFERYMALVDRVDDAKQRYAFSRVADTLSTLGRYIRFIAVELDTDSGPDPVSSPSLQITSDVVERALSDAEQLIQSRGAVSGLDRVHTAIHGFLRAACAKQPIVVSDDASLTTLFKLLREQHPSLRAAGSHSAAIERVLRAMATIVDALNPLRNRGSIAHPNEALLEEAEAMLVINSVRTLLHYLNAKLQ